MSWNYPYPQFDPFYEDRVFQHCASKKMAIKLTLSNDELWHMLQERGYEIIIEPLEDGGKSAKFRGKYSTQDSDPKMYSGDWEDHQIRRDLLMKLLEWTGLRPRIELSY